RWGVGLEPTVLNFDEARLVSSLGKTVESVEEEERGGKARKTLQRIERDILDVILSKPLPTNEILDAVTGKSATILDVLEQMVSKGRVVAEQDGKTKRYRAVEIQNEVELKEAA